MTASEFRAEARKKLNGKWGKAALIVLAYMAIFFVLGFIEGILPDSFSAIFNIFKLIIEMPLAFGLVISLFKLYNDEEVNAFDFLNSGFSNFGKSWGIAFQMALKIIVPIILIIISYALIFIGLIGTIGSGIGSLVMYSRVATTAVNGFGATTIIGFILLIVGMVWAIVKSYYYQLSYIVAADNPELSSKESVEKSKELMENKRGKLFGLQLSFIGWAILATLTFGIGYLWLLPYIQFAIIAFYKNTLGENVEIKVETENQD